MSNAKAETVLTTSLNAETLDQTLEILQAASKEARLHLGGDGLSVKVVDPANVMMINLELSPSAFEFTPDGSYTVGSNLGALQDYTSKADGEQTVDFSFAPKTRELNVEYRGYEIDMACIDPDAIRQEPDLPDLDLPNTVTLKTSDFKEALEMANLVSDQVSLCCDPTADEKFWLDAEGDTDDILKGFDADDFRDETKVTEETLSWYSLGYLIDGADSYSGLFQQIPADEVTLTLGDEFPVLMDFDYADGSGHVTALLAPRIKSD